jgi:hypothetical protein
VADHGAGMTLAKCLSVEIIEYALFLGNELTGEGLPSDGLGLASLKAFCIRYEMYCQSSRVRSGGSVVVVDMAADAPDIH